MPPTTVTDPDVTAAFPRRPRPGIVMGLRGGQVALLSTAGLLLPAGDVHRGVPVAVPRRRPGDQRGCRPAGGRHRPGPSRLPVAHRPNLARGPGRARQHHHGPAHQGRHHPRTTFSTAAWACCPNLAAVAVHELDRVGYLYHPHAGTLTGIIEVTSPEFLLRDPRTATPASTAWEGSWPPPPAPARCGRCKSSSGQFPDDGSRWPPTRHPPHHRA